MPVLIRTRPGTQTGPVKENTNTILVVQIPAQGEPIEAASVSASVCGVGLAI